MQDFRKFKNIIFDLGGVILDIDPDKTMQAFRDIFQDRFFETLNFYKNSGIAEEFEKGIISASDFRTRLIEYSGKDVSIDKFDYAWNATLIDFKMERIELIKNLKKHFNTYLLSNTNIIHHEVFTGWLNKKYSTSWDEMFHKAWFSHEINEKKPDPEIYLKVIELGKLNPHETVFLDDLDENLMAAKKFGISTIKVTKDNNINSIFLSTEI